MKRRQIDSDAEAPVRSVSVKRNPANLMNQLCATGKPDIDRVKEEYLRRIEKRKEAGS